MLKSHQAPLSSLPFSPYFPDQYSLPIYVLCLYSNYWINLVCLLMHEYRSVYTTVNQQRIRNCELLQSKRNICIPPLFLKAQDTVYKEKNLQARSKNHYYLDVAWSLHTCTHSGCVNTSSDQPHFQHWRGTNEILLPS